MIIKLSEFNLNSLSFFINNYLCATLNVLILHYFFYMTKTDQRSSFLKYLIIFWSIFGFIIVGIIILFALIAHGKLGYMPTFEDLENPKTSLASEVISSDGNLLGKYYNENRTYVDYDELTPVLVEALVATEDIRYYDHSGIDLRGLGRVFKGIITGNSGAGGGSTISQQLAKLLFPREKMGTPIRLVIRKFREWVIAVKLERSYTKEEIITMYLNMYDFNYNAIGIHSAASTYFKTTPDSLTLTQAAMLVGMAQNSSLINPVRRPELSLKRRNTVLGQMHKYGFISTASFKESCELPIDLTFSRIDHKKGPAPYFREHLRSVLKARKPERSKYASWQFQKYKEDSIAWATNPVYGWCNKNFKADGAPYDLYNDGLKIYTTIDSRMQQYAEESVVEHLSADLQPAFENELVKLQNPPFSDDMDSTEVESLMKTKISQTDRYWTMKNNGASKDEIYKAFEKPVDMTIFSWKGEIDTTMTPLDSLKYYMSFLRSSLMAMEPGTGYVKAWVGGPNFKHFMYDMVHDGKRQVGSTVKPFLYTLAMQNGLSPCLKVPNVPVSFDMFDGTRWTPKNSSHQRENEMVTLKWGLANSVNHISAWVMKKFNSPKSVVKIMHKMGVQSTINPVYSLFLGTSDISLYEMVGAYGTFSNKGIYAHPLIVTKIADKNGNIVGRFQTSKNDAIDEETAFLMLNLMEGVINEGSGRRLRWNPEYGGLTAEIAGKTGTTQNQSDGWFMGITPRLVAGVWSGADLRSIHFKGIAFGQGANMALPIWGRFMNKVYADPALGYSQDEEFEKPQDFHRDLDCDKQQESNIENVMPDEDNFF